MARADSHERLMISVRGKVPNEGRADHRIRFRRGRIRAEASHFRGQVFGLTRVDMVASPRATNQRALGTHSFFQNQRRIKALGRVPSEVPRKFRSR
jgi:hypothetical protein